MILVTGASGTVGSEVVKALGGRSARVRAGYRTRPQNVPAGVESVALDYERPETVRPALQGVETLFLLSNTVEPEKTVMDEAKRAGVKRVVKLSVIGAAQEGFVFARWHRAVERHIEASGLAWTFLRPNSFMQNVVNYMGETIRAQSAIYSAAGDSAISHIDARDIGATGARVLTEKGHEGKAYELTGPAALTGGQIARILTRVLGREIRYVPISFEQYQQAAVAAGTPEAYADALVDLNRYYTTGQAAVVTPAVRQLTGRDPIPFEQFAKDHADKLR
jgi:uncharacterized protein YbjT (DUF2867 family)